MGRKPINPPEQESPTEFPQVEPPGVSELHATTNIRFVMFELAKMIERVDNLSRAVEKAPAATEKAIDKLSVETKDRFAEMRTDAKEDRQKVVDLKTSIDSFKGAMKVFGGIYALALVLTGAFLAWYLKPAPVAPVAAIPIAQPAPVSAIAPTH